MTSPSDIFIKLFPSVSIAWHIIFLGSAVNTFCAYCCDGPKKSITYFHIGILVVFSLEVFIHRSFMDILAWIILGYWDYNRLLWLEVVGFIMIIWLHDAFTGSLHWVLFLILFPLHPGPGESVCCDTSVFGVKVSPMDAVILLLLILMTFHLHGHTQWWQ